MAKAIYCLKIFLFRDQFQLTKQEDTLIANICVFVIHCYIKAWFSAPNTLEAPFNDILFLKTLHKFKEINEEIAKVAIKKFLNHLWYLNEECVAFTIFDNRIGTDEKQRMAKKITRENPDEDCEEQEIKKKLILNQEDVINFIAKDIPTDLLSSNSLNLFRRFGISTEFLYTDPSLWELRKDYQKGKNIISSLKSINDTAERGVKLIEEYNNKITKNEEQKQFLLQVVQDYRKQFPKANKNPMNKKFQ